MAYQPLSSLGSLFGQSQNSGGGFDINKFKPVGGTYFGNDALLGTSEKMGTPAKTPTVTPPSNKIPSNQVAPAKPAKTNPNPLTPAQSTANAQIIKNINNGQSYNQATGQTSAPKTTTTTPATPVIPTTNTNQGTSGVSTTSRYNPATGNVENVPNTGANTGNSNTGLFGRAVGTGLNIATNGNASGTAQNTSQNIANTGTAGATQAANGLFGIAAQGSPQVQQAIKNVAGLQQAQGEIANNPNIAAEVASGRGQNIGNEIASAQTGVQNALAQQSQQITAGNEAGNLALGNTGQQITAAGQAGNLALTNQGQQIGAANNVATATAPTFGAPGSIGYNPLDPNTTNNAFQGTLQNYAQLRSTGQESLIPSSITGNAVLNDQITQMAKRINPSYNANIAAGVAGTQTQQAQTVEQYKSSLQQGQNLQSQFNDLIKSFNLNPNDINVANQGVQLIASNTSDPRYKILSNYVNDIANTYSQILTPPGGSATDTTRSLAASMLDATASGQSLVTVMKSLDAAAQAKIAGTQTATYGGSGGSSSSGGGLYSW